MTEMTHTPGPWRWEVNRNSHRVELTGTAGKVPFDNVVLSFKRWGTQSATPVFWFWNDPNISDEPKKAHEIAIPAEGREHHEDWFRIIDHPDAYLIAAAPDLLAVCKEFVRKCENSEISASVPSDMYEAIKKAEKGKEAK